MENKGRITPRNFSPSVSKQYRQSRRRPAHLRTKTGCLTCRNRKKKCDERCTQCLNCVKLNLECVWQSDGVRHQQPEARSPSTSDTVCSGHSATETALEEKQRIQQLDSDHLFTQLSREVGDSARPRALLVNLEASEEGSGDSSPIRMLLPTESLHGLSLQIELPPSPASNKRSRPLFQFLISTFIPQLLRPSADSQMCEEFNRRSLALAFEHPFCMHALLACCGAEIPADDPEYRELARFHYTHAVNGLRKILDDGALGGQWVVTMLGIMMLCIYERTKQKPSPGVAIHITGAAQLMRLHSQAQKDSIEYTGVGQLMQRLVHESFIFHVTTSLPFQSPATIDAQALSTTGAYQYEIESALSLAEEALSDHFDVGMFSQPSSPVLGFPPQLFRCIYTVYRLYQTSSSDEVSMHLCQRLDNDLCRWDKRLEASSAELFSPDSSTKKANEGFNSMNAHHSSHALHQSRLIGPKLYILGCRVLLRRMRGVDLASVEVGAEGLTHQGMRMIQQLQPKKDYYADYYCWPFLAIGINLRSPTDREMLLAKALAFWKATNNPTMRRLIDMLPVYWQSGD